MALSKKILLSYNQDNLHLIAKNIVVRDPVSKIEFSPSIVEGNVVELNKDSVKEPLGDKKPALLKFVPTLTASGQEMPFAEGMEFDPTLKKYVHYMRLSGNAHKFTVVDSKNAGALQFVLDDEPFIVPANTINTIMRAINKAPNIGSAFNTIFNVLHSNGRSTTPTQIAAVTIECYRRYLATKGVQSYLEGSGSGQMIRATMDGTMRPYFSFLVAMRMYGFFSAFGMWFTQKNCYGCNVGLVDVNELQIYTTPATAALGRL
jgi:hypothetical protein